MNARKRDVLQQDATGLYPNGLSRGETAASKLDSWHGHNKYSYI